jgi:hypothetical protein
MQTKNEKIAAKTKVLQSILDDMGPDAASADVWLDSTELQHRLIASGYLIVEL